MALAKFGKLAPTIRVNLGGCFLMEFERCLLHRYWVRTSLRRGDLVHPSQRLYVFDFYDCLM